MKLEVYIFTKWFLSTGIKDRIWFKWFEKCEQLIQKIGVKICYIIFLYSRNLLITFLTEVKIFFNLTNYTIPEIPKYVNLSCIEKDAPYIFNKDIITLIKSIVKQLIGDNKPYNFYIPQSIFRRIIYLIVEKYPIFINRYEKII